MKRGKPMKRSARPYSPQMDAAERRARNLAALVASAPTSARGVITRVTGVTPAPKSPADRNPRVRELAEGEQCCYRLPECLHPRTDTTVLCHTNSLSDQKGIGYKAHDSEGIFGCLMCHQLVDGQRIARQPLSLPEFERAMLAARVRMNARLAEITTSPSERPWRRSAAQWVLDQLAARARRGNTGETT